MASYAVLKRGVDEAVLNQNGSFHPMVVTESASETSVTTKVDALTVTVPADTGYLYHIKATNITSDAGNPTVTLESPNETTLASVTGTAATELDPIEVMIEASGTAQSVILTFASSSSSDMTAQLTVFRYFTQSEVDSGITIA